MTTSQKTQSAKRHTTERYFDDAIKDPNTSTFIAFTSAVKGRNLDKNLIGRFFNKPVDKSDYERHDRDMLIEFLHALSIKDSN